MEKFKKTLRIVIAVAVISGAIFAVASTSIPTVVYGCEQVPC